MGLWLELICMMPERCYSSPYSCYSAPMLSHCAGLCGFIPLSVHIVHIHTAVGVGYKQAIAGLRGSVELVLLPLPVRLILNTCCAWGQMLELRGFIGIVETHTHTPAAARYAPCPSLSKGWGKGGRTVLRLHWAP